MKDAEGVASMVVLHKVAYRLGRRGPELDEVTPCLADEHHGEDPATSSIRRPSDLAPYKPGTDVILVGHAHGQNPSATFVDVTLRVGNLQKIVRAHGLRALQLASFGGLSAGPARPLREPVPLRWELAYGGVDRSDPERPIAEPKNPLGRGFAKNGKALVGQPAPQLEDPARPFGGRDPVPASFGALHRHWQPRVSFAGTYDDAWMETRMPILPRDFDDRYHVTAPPDQWSLRPLFSDDPIELLGATEEGALRARLPRISPRFRALVDGATKELPTHLDTIFIDADARRVELTHRASVRLPPKWERLQSIEVFS
jgi:hypothetical protein